MCVWMLKPINLVVVGMMVFLLLMPLFQRISLEYRIADRITHESITIHPAQLQQVTLRRTVQSLVMGTSKNMSGTKSKLFDNSQPPYFLLDNLGVSRQWYCVRILLMMTPKRPVKP